MQNRLFEIIYITDSVLWHDSERFEIAFPNAED
jgi:hypothetical protein